MDIQSLCNKAKENHDQILRIGFAIFLAIWGLDRIFRADLWATANLMGHFYGNIGLITGFVIGLGVIQVLIALSFCTNFKVKFFSLILLLMLIGSTVITVASMFSYLFFGGAPIPAILFADHFPLIAGAWSIYAHQS